MSRIALIILLALIYISSSAQFIFRRHTRAAASCSDADVQGQIDLAVDGDIVAVPAGSCTWTTKVIVTGKRIVLRGAGIGNTNITDNTSDSALKLSIDASTFSDVSGFTFIKQHANDNGMIVIQGTVGEVGFRFHHNRLFDNGVGGGRGLYVYSSYGLIDHVTFDVTDTGASDQMITTVGSYQGTDGGYTPWTQPLAFGTDQAVYVEDCTFTIASQSEDVMDAYDGARLVIRHNTFNSSAVGFHGTDSGQARGPVSVELYANTFTNSAGTQRRAVTNRGGTALYFDNTYGGSTAWSGFTLMDYRATITGPYSWGVADGTVYDIGSEVLSSNGSRQTAAVGTGARFLLSNPDTICTGAVAGDCQRGFDGTGSRGYPTRDQPGRGPNGQTLSPVYAWNNGAIMASAYDGGCSACSGFPVATWIAENRDYYNYVASGYDGTVGVGRGTLAARPSTCTPLTAYFATDSGTQGTLYQCATTNTWTVYYTPYAYPHSLGGH